IFFLSFITVVTVYHRAPLAFVLFFKKLWMKLLERDRKSNGFIYELPYIDNLRLLSNDRNLLIYFLLLIPIFIYELLLVSNGLLVVFQAPITNQGNFTFELKVCLDQVFTFVYLKVYFHMSFYYRTVFKKSKESVGNFKIIFMFDIGQLIYLNIVFAQAFHPSPFLYHFN